MFKRKSIKIVIISLLIFTMAAGSVAAITTVGQRTLLANFNNIQIVINGETLVPRDALGNVVEPFTVDGTTYLPVRALAEAFGKDVDWDPTTNSVIITSPEGTPTQEPATPAPPTDAVPLSSLTHLLAHRDNVIAPNPWRRDGRMRMNNENFAYDVMSIFEHRTTQRTADFTIDGQFSRMTGRLFLAHESRTASGAQDFVVWGDGVELERISIGAGIWPIDFDIDISGVEILRVGIEFERAISNRRVGISNTMLIP